jgi:hypothetical protein
MSKRREFGEILDELREDYRRKATAQAVERVKLWVKEKVIPRKYAVHMVTQEVREALMRAEYTLRERAKATLAGEDKRIEAMERDEKIKARALELLASNPRLSDTDLGENIAKALFDGKGGEAIRKKLPRLLRDE